MKEKVFSGLFWKFSERMCAQLITFIVSIVLARLLTPADYGGIALVNIFIALANVLVVSGFGSALIQKEKADDLDFTSVFYFNIVFSFLLYGLLYWAAPMIADFYSIEILSPVLRVLGVRIPIAAVNSVQQAYVSKNMLFKRFFWSTLFGTLLSGVVGVAMAYAGFGIWALVAQYLTNTTTDTLVLWVTVRWRPIKQFSLSRLKSLLSFGWKLLASALLDTGYSQLRSLIIGKVYKPSDLAFYDRGQQYPTLVVTNINSSISSVLFPAIAECQNDREKVKAMTRRAIKTSSYVMWPLMIGLAVVANPLVSLMLTDKWLPCVPYLQIACFTFGLYPIHTANLEAIKALGRSDLFLRLEIIKKVIGIAVLLFVMRQGVMAIALSLAVTTIIGTFINAYPNTELLGYRYLEQIGDILPSFLLACLMGTCVYPITLIGLSRLLTLTLQVIVGTIIYIVGSKLLHLESFDYIVGIVKPYVKKQKNM
ncbi:MAG: lipopolysaccharide biosynthesis protein [Oscillospiraceae bacterium]